MEGGSQGGNVDIGSGTNPYIEYLRKDLLDDGPTYLIDNDLPKVKKMRSTTKNFLPELGDASKLRFKDGELGTVFCANFLGDPRVVGEKTELADMETFAVEWNRVLKKGGNLVIFEFSTPANINNVKRVFEARGFELAEENHGKDTSKIYTYPLHVDEASYSLVFKKK